jgi:fibronectin-binding autotransporter adhesin
LTTGGNNSNTVFSGTISDGAGVLALTKTGTGTMTLSGTNTYSGGTTVAGGVISVTADTNLGNIAGGVNLAGGELLTTADGFISARGLSRSVRRDPL